MSTLSDVGAQIPHTLVYWKMGDSLQVFTDTQSHLCLCFLNGAHVSIMAGSAGWFPQGYFYACCSFPSTSVLPTQICNRLHQFHTWFLDTLYFRAGTTFAVQSQDNDFQTGESEVVLFFQGHFHSKFQPIVAFHLSPWSSSHFVLLGTGKLLLIWYRARVAQHTVWLWPSPSQLSNGGVGFLSCLAATSKRWAGSYKRTLISVEPRKPHPYVPLPRPAWERAEGGAAVRPH